MLSSEVLKMTCLTSYCNISAIQSINSFPDLFLAVNAATANKFAPLLVITLFFILMFILRSTSEFSVNFLTSTFIFALISAVLAYMGFLPINYCLGFGAAAAFMLFYKIAFER